jgi:RND family efflux transporter MFP subunit
LSYTQIRSPINGRIGQHMVDIGNLVQPQDTLLAIIQTIDPIYAMFDLSENDLLRFMAMLRKNELPDPEKTPPTLHLGLPNEQGFPHEGKLDYRDLKVDPSTGTARRRGIFPNPGWQLIPGMFVKISASIGGPLPRLLVEERAIGTDQRGDYLLVVNEKNVVEYRTVRLGIHIGAMRVIEDGVTKNDWIVVNGLQRARPGATVTPERTKMSAPATINVEESAESIGGTRAPAAGKVQTPSTTDATSEMPATTPQSPVKTEGDANEKAALPTEKVGPAK